MNKWGLQAFLYQSATQAFLQALLVDVHWGLSDRCTRQRLDAGFAVAYVALQVAATYAVAWAMSEGGAVGRYLHGLWRAGAEQLVALSEARPALSPRRPAVVQYA